MKRILWVTGIFLLLLSLVSLPLLSGCSSNATTTTLTTTSTSVVPTSSSATSPTSTVPVLQSTTTSAAPLPTIKIGMVTSLSGQMATAFKSMYDAAQPTADIINQAGGVTINGQQYNIDFVVMDDQSAPTSGVAAATKLIQDGVKYIIEPLVPTIDLALLPSTTAAKVITVNPSQSDASNFGPDYPYNFCALWLKGTPGIFNYLQKYYPKVKNIAYLVPDDPGINTTYDIAVAEGQKRGLTVVDKERYPEDITDFSAILTKILSQKPDAIDLVGGNAIFGTDILNTARDLGFSGPIFVDNIVSDPHLLISLVKPENCYNFFEGCPDVLSDQMSPMIKQLRVLVEKAGKPFIFDCANFISAATLIVTGIQSAQSLDTDKIKAAFESNPTINTVWGTGTWAGNNGGVNHMVQLNSIPVSTITNGQVSFQYVPAQ